MITCLLSAARHGPGFTFVGTALVLLVVVLVFGVLVGNAKVVRLARVIEGSPEWAIAIYTGRSPQDLRRARGARRPVLTRADVTDADAVFVADPFMIREDHTWHMFFEVLDRSKGKGAIAWALSCDACHWHYQRIVLDEPFHLSYPQVFRCEAHHYMVPESSAAGAIRLYRATDFPTRWEYAGDLIRGQFVDPTLFRHDGMWWMFATACPSRYSNLRLFVAQDLRGPWKEHPKSPIIPDDPRAARPAGSVLVDRGRVFRFAQDCELAYGSAVRAFEITSLTLGAYEEREVDTNPMLKGSNRGWNALGMHHVDIHRVGEDSWIACVDGFTKPRYLELRGLRRRIRLD